MDTQMDDLEAQIAALQAEKAKRLALAEKRAEKQRKEDAKVLIASTPTKKEKYVPPDLPLPSKPSQPIFKSAKDALLEKGKIKPRQELPMLPQVGPSRMSSSLAMLRKSSSTSSTTISSKFNGSKPALTGSSTSQAIAGMKRTRSDSPDRSSKAENVKKERIEREEDALTIIEKLELGPKEFGIDPEGEESWEFVEPNSGLRLSKRISDHSQIQENLRGRYYLPPSLLYSVIRLSRDGATYDVPVDQDWVTIAVVAERGEVRVTGGSSKSSTNRNGNDNNDDDEDGGNSSDEEDKEIKPGEFSLKTPPRKKPLNPYKSRNSKGKEKKDLDDDDGRKRRPKKYINLKLCALPSRTRLINKESSFGVHGGQSGDALLQLLLFESEHVTRSDPDSDGDVKKIYKGGSGGAYEKWCNLNVGDVIGLISPRVLRPLKTGSGSPHPLTLPLALNPVTDQGLFVIGQSRDLGCCTAIQKDGNRCKSWIDTRQSQVCEYHLALSLQKTRNNRAEFSQATSSYHPSISTLKSSSLGNSSARGGVGGGKYDPKSGLLPRSGPQIAPRGIDNGGGGATYIITGGSTISTNRRNEGSDLNERIGRGAAERQKRKWDKIQNEMMIKKLSGDGSEGAKALKAVESRLNKPNTTTGKSTNTKNVRGNQQKDNKWAEKGKGEGKDKEIEEGLDEKLWIPVKRTFTAEHIKRIGFDPTLQDDGQGIKIDKGLRNLKDENNGFTFNPNVKIKRQNVKVPVMEMNLKSKADTPVVTGSKGDESAVESEEGEDMIDLD